MDEAVGLHQADAMLEAACVIKLASLAYPSGIRSVERHVGGSQAFEGRIHSRRGVFIPRCTGRVVEANRPAKGPLMDSKRPAETRTLYQ
jgi:hypothetical protein